jgi:hypothetical protein
MELQTPVYPAKFSEFEPAHMSRYIWENLVREPADGSPVPTALTPRSKKDARIFRIRDNVLPISLWIFIHDICQRQKVVDGCRKYLNVALKDLGVLHLNLGEGTKEEKTAGKKEALERLVGPTRVQELDRSRLLGKMEDGAFGMRSCHMDLPGWLPYVELPSLDKITDPTTQAYYRYIGDFKKLPNKVKKDSAKRGKDINTEANRPDSAYVEYSLNGVWRDTQGRLVYDYVNQRFYLTLHYQQNTILNVENPFVLVEHMPDEPGKIGPASTPLSANQVARVKLMKTKDLIYSEERHNRHWRAKDHLLK